MPFTDAHPSGSILGAGNLFLAALTTSRTPTTFTITNTAAAVIGAATLQLSSNVAVTLRKNVVLTFGAVSVTVTAATPLTTVAAAVPVIPLLASLGAAATATTINPAELLGLQKMGRPRKMTTVDIRSLKSGLGMEKRPTSIEFAFPISGWVSSYDDCYSNIVRPASETGNEVYAIFEGADNQRYKGPALIMDVDDPVEVDKIITYSATLMFQGIPTRETIV
jgi:hypothetical protein